MKDEVKTKLEEAIGTNAEKAKSAENALDAMQYSQAAVNLSNVIIGMEHHERSKG